MRFRPLHGNRYDDAEAPPPTDGIAFDGLIADKAFDGDALVAELNERGVETVISQHPGRARKLKIDRELRERRHLVETFFRKLKAFKRIAMRARKTDQSFKATIHLAAAVNSRRISTGPSRCSSAPSPRH